VKRMQNTTPRRGSERHGITLTNCMLVQVIDKI
jgi:hypothetical protein